MKFEARVRKVLTKEVSAKAGGNVTILEFTTDPTKSKVGTLSIQVGDTVTLEINPTQSKMVEDVNEKGERVLVSATDDTEIPSPMDQALRTLCICGHERSLHGEYSCIGNAGMCACSTFMAAGAVEPPKPGETAEVIEELEAKPDCARCGHAAMSHGQAGECGELIDEEEFGVTTCPCPGYAEADYPVPGDCEGLAGNLDDELEGGDGPQTPPARGNERQDFAAEVKRRLKRRQATVSGKAGAA